MSQVPPPSPQTPPPYPGQPGPAPAGHHGAPPAGQPQPGQPSPTYGAPPPGYPLQPQGYPQHAPGLSGPPAEVRPKARWFWIGGGIIALGVVAAIATFVLGFAGIANTVDDFERVTPDGGGASIDSAGEYVIYNEGLGSFADVIITSPDGEAIPLSFYSGGLTYGFGGRSGNALYTFDAPGAGVYRVETNANIAIGKSIAGDLVRTIVLPFAIGGLTFVLGLIVIIVTAVRRSGSKKRAARGI